jgi:ribosomal-protein-serine acetyltransferase
MIPSFPDHFETERLWVRAVRPGDGAMVYQAIMESLNELRPWMPWARGTQSIEESEAYAREAASRWRTREELGMRFMRKSDGQFLGAIGMHHIDWSVPRFEIGYWVRTSQQGHGYVTEAVNGLTQFAFERLKAVRMEIRCDAANRRSAAVAERAGYTLEARLRYERRNAVGALADTLIYVKLAENVEQR